MSGLGRRAFAPSSDSRLILRSDGQVAGFDLPEGVLPKDEQWHPMTVEWWEAWRRSPQGSTMVTEPDWMFLLDTALIHHQMWSSGRWEFANEIRMRVAQFGATPAARRALKVEIEVREEFAVGAVGSAAVMDEERRRRLSEQG